MRDRSRGTRSCLGRSLGRQRRQASWAAASVVGRRPAQRLGGRLSDPSGCADRRIEQLPERDPEADDEAERGEGDEQDERAGWAQEVAQRPARNRPMRPPETSTTCAAPTHTGVRDGEPENGDPPARPGSLAGSPFQPPARRQEEERQQPAHRPEPRREDGRSTSWSAHPRPGRSSAIRVIAPRTRRTSPRIDRTTSGVRRAAHGVRPSRTR